MSEYLYNFSKVAVVATLTVWIVCRIAASWLKSLDKVMLRTPDLVVGEPEYPYLRRWYIIPKNRWFNVYLHQFLKSDDDRALHDHPWVSLSYAVSGYAGEIYASLEVEGVYYLRTVRAGDFIFRRARHTHRMMIEDGPFVTLFITGPVVRNWGFWCPKGWVSQQEFLGPDGKSGKGCE